MPTHGLSGVATRAIVFAEEEGAPECGTVLFGSTEEGRRPRGAKLT